MIIEEITKPVVLPSVDRLLMRGDETPDERNCRIFELNEAARARAAAKRKVIAFPFHPNNFTAA